jgi:peroxiredoxin
MDTPQCDFGLTAPDFRLVGVDGAHWSLQDCRGEKGTVVMFLSNHCPYVQAINSKLVRDMNILSESGVKGVAIMPNDTGSYPQDSFENMKKVAAEQAYPFPYLIDGTQDVARAYGAVCTPDFFGYNANLELQYRGRLDATTPSNPGIGAKRDLLLAMQQIAATGEGPAEQLSSMGCSIKWKAA